MFEAIKKMFKGTPTPDPYEERMQRFRKLHHEALLKLVEEQKEKPLIRFKSMSSLIVEAAVIAQQQMDE